MPTITCQKCKTEFEVTEEEAKYMTVCRPCYAKTMPKKTNKTEDCIMRQVALKCLAMSGYLRMEMNDGRIWPTSKKMADELVKYMKNG